MTPHALAAMNAAIARPVIAPLPPCPTVAIEYRSTATHQAGIASAACQQALLDWAACWEARWPRHDAFCSAPVQGADGRFYCRFRRAWRR